LELKVFAFSVDVVSFVKSVEESEGANSTLKSLLNEANGFYSNFIDAEDSTGKYDKNSFYSESKKCAQKCLDLLQSIELESKFLNEKVDLIIEVAGLIKMIPIQEEL